MSEATNPGAGGGSSVSGSSLGATTPAVSNGRRGLLRTGGRRWLDNDIARLRALIAAGKTHAECAAALGRTKSAISCATERFGMTNTYADRWSADEMRTLLTLKHRGLTLRLIARRMGKTKGAVDAKWQKLRARIVDRRNLAS